MTQEQKAKAYDEALNWMRELYPGLHGATKEDAEHFFPELAESDDERVRKSIIHILQVGGYMSPEEKDKAFAYLEKQKEQKSVECIEFDNEFEKQVSHLLASVLNGEWEYDEGFVKHAAQSLLGYAKNEMKPDEWDKREKLFTKALQTANARIGQLFEENRKLKEQKPNYCLYGGDPSVGRCRWCYAACSARLADVHTDEEKEYIRTIKSIISDFIRDKKPENLAYYQRIYDWLDGRHVPFSCGHENGKPAEWVLPEDFEEAVYKVANFISPFDNQEELRKTSHRFAEQLLSLAKKELDKTPDPVFSKQEYESSPIISTDTTSVKLEDLDGKALLHTADKSYQIGFRDGVASVKPELSDEDEGELQNAIDALEFLGKKGVYKSESGYNAALQAASWLKNITERFNLQPKEEWSEEDEKIWNHIIDCAESKAWIPFNEISWLVAHKPQFYWKPSEEQMAMLLAVINEPNNAGAESCHLALKSLHEHLKKLM